MPRPPNDDLVRSWKINLGATTAGKVEALLFDPILGKPRYAARKYIVERLLENWLTYIETGHTLPLPTLDEVRNARP